MSEAGFVGWESSLSFEVFGASATLNNQDKKTTDKRKARLAITLRVCEPLSNQTCETLQALKRTYVR